MFSIFPFICILREWLVSGCYRWYHRSGPAEAVHHLFPRRLLPEQEI